MRARAVAPVPGEAPGPVTLSPKLISTETAPFICGNGIPVHPTERIGDVQPEILIVPEMWLAPDDAVDDRYDGLKTWLREPPRGEGNLLVPSARGQRLSVHGV